MSRFVSFDRHFAVGELFHSGLYCNGSVFLFEQCACNDAESHDEPGVHVSLPSNSYVCAAADRCDDFQFISTESVFLMDRSNTCMEVLTVLSSEPLRFECIRYILTSPHDIMTDYDFREDFLSHRTSDGVVIDGYVGDEDEVLVPSSLYGEPVLRVELDDLSLTESTTAVIISEGIKELRLDFEDARYLRRLTLPKSGRFISPPEHIRFTQWYQELPDEPVYLGGYYCGTPGGGSGHEALIIPEGIVGVAPCADFNAYWRKIELPDSIDFIGEYAFARCPCLEELKLPISANHIGEGAFQSCPRLAGIRLPDGLQGPVECFQLSDGLQEVSMPEACWEDQSYYFSKCPRIVLRGDDTSTVLSRNLSPSPITGKSHSHPESGTLLAGGRAYPNLSYFTRHKIREVTDYRDCFGIRVRHIREKDPQIRAANGGEYWNHFWLTTGSGGVTLITKEDFTNVYIVHDGISYDELPDCLKPLAKDMYASET